MVREAIRTRYFQLDCERRHPTAPDEPQQLLYSLPLREHLQVSVRSSQAAILLTSHSPHNVWGRENRPEGLAVPCYWCPAKEKASESLCRVAEAQCLDGRTCTIGFAELRRFREGFRNRRREEDHEGNRKPRYPSHPRASCPLESKARRVPENDRHQARKARQNGWCCPALRDGTEGNRKSLRRTTAVQPGQVLRGFQSANSHGFRVVGGCRPRENPLRVR
mmetsp:Transcript_7451/g.13903  ORF Transcript_7451/g.13903 Transcript_7451/m.13903 type:complete len:221 (-) Transcript_7451:2050-2712(-)